jgi:spore coat protein CotH
VIERVDATFLKKHGMNDKGNLYKAEDHRANLFAKSDPLEGYEKKMNANASSEDLGELLSLITNTPATNQDFQRALEPFLNLTDHRIYTAVNIFAMNQDAYSKNYYLYHDPQGKKDSQAAQFRFIPWDADATFGNNWDGKHLEPDEKLLQGENDALSRRLYSIAEYKKIFLTELKDHLEKGAFHPQHLKSKIQELAERISSSVDQNCHQWDCRHDFSVEITRLIDVITFRQCLLLDEINPLLTNMESIR